MKIITDIDAERETDMKIRETADLTREEREALGIRTPKPYREDITASPAKIRGKSKWGARLRSANAIPDDPGVIEIVTRSDKRWLACVLAIVWRGTEPDGTHVALATISTDPTLVSFMPVMQAAEAAHGIRPTYSSTHRGPADHA